MTLHPGIVNETLLYDVAERIAARYVEKLTHADAKATGDLIASVEKWEFKWNGDTLQLIFNLPGYWKYIEEGRGPTKKSEGGVLYPAIREWVRVKKIVPRAGSDGKIPTESQLAWAITKKIHQRGYFDPDHHGKHPLKEALEQCNADGTLREMAHSVLDQYYKEIHTIVGQIYTVRN